MGDGTTTSSSTPVDVVADQRRDRHHDRHEYGALTGTSGTAGRNLDGQLGDGHHRSQHARGRQRIDDWRGRTRHGARGRPHRVVTSAGGLKCWGDNNDGEVGIGTTTDILTPVDVVGLSGVPSCIGRRPHLCHNHDGWTQMQNGFGQRPADSPTPVDVVGLTSEVAAVFAGFAHSCAVTNAGAVKAGNEFGELGDGTMTNSNIPVDMLG
ncbi:hypothetical protein KFU94_36665 [Chloroflexi bacterium TSY]|nr:hypothetical protein [Chloroflexi bacterium TSY]